MFLMQTRLDYRTCSDTRQFPTLALALADPLISQGNEAFPGLFCVSGRFSFDLNLRIAGEITKKRETQMHRCSKEAAGGGA